MAENGKHAKETTKQCPNCQLLNPPAAQHCDCGYNFRTRSIEQPEKEGKGGRKLSLRGALVIMFVAISVALIPALALVLLLHVWGWGG